jgi:5'-methylthioadenosine phosphorylase
MSAAVVGVIGGSGVYELAGLEAARWERVASPFGEPSDALLRGRKDGVELVFLPRHGRGHRIPPSEIDYRANIDALKRCGVTDLISISACGSLRESFAPGDFVLVDQYVDRTRQRPASFFGRGCVAHVSLAAPICARLAARLADAAAGVDVAVHRGGTYLAMEGPQFSTLAESKLYRALGCDVIGMTNMPEARLAREAEICYASVAMVTDYDCWHAEYDAVQVSSVIEVVRRNAANARELVARAVGTLAVREAPCSAGCDRALESAILTAPDARDPALVERLAAVAGRALRAERESFASGSTRVDP